MSYLFGGFHSSRYDSDDEPEPSADLTLKRRSEDRDQLSNDDKREKLTSALDDNGDTITRALNADGRRQDDEDDGAMLDANSFLSSSADTNKLATEAKSELCEECGDQPANVVCIECKDKFCAVCFKAIHRNGQRTTHKTTPYHSALTAAADDTVRETREASSSSSSAHISTAPMDGANDVDDDGLAAMQATLRSSNGSAAAAITALPLSAMSDKLPHLSAAWFHERARYIPLRLTLEERKALRLVEAALNVSEYTDKIDVLSSKDKVRRIQEQLRDMCSILSGLVVASDYKLGQQVIRDKDFTDNATFFQSLFEIARRHKVRNPEKMRSAYGKLMYLLQDSQQPEINELMGFALVRPLKTVYIKLQESQALALLTDPRLPLAVSEIKAQNKTRTQIDREIKQKEFAIKSLAQRYANSSITSDEVSQCIYSIGDNQTFLVQNRNCCDDMIQYLQDFFQPNTYTEPYSLAILFSRDGARLTHSHSQQFAYVHQSLLLWRSILNEMFKLWCCTEDDLLDPDNPYRLRNTGQGLNRVQSAPRVGRLMHNILAHCQQSIGHWVGSSVIHLGDHNVPSAYMFIDKYNQVARILNPIVHVIKEIDRMFMAKAELRMFITKVYGDNETLKRVILTDFFRHAFDGSGSDNFFDAGSCIDGRLTSAWNWCSNIEKKPYYHIFLLTGFTGFDGRFE